jgi:HSP20 family molecular chaperone IbpA
MGVKELYMKGAKGYMDLGSIFDEIFEAAQSFSDEFHRNFNQFGNNCGPGFDHQGPFMGKGPGFDHRGPFAGKGPFDENIDYYPNYSYPPMNVFMTSDRSMCFEFALAGFDEKDISLSFQGDYMVFSASLPAAVKVNTEDDTVGDASGDETGGNGRFVDENIRYFKRRLKMKDIEKQKYFVPLDKYAQEKVKAVFKNGILKVSIPPKDEPDQNDGIKIEIIKEGN